MANKLFIPRKNTGKPAKDNGVTQEDYGIDMRAIENWSAGAGGLYASLTGPGETASPGGLEQQGYFIVLESDDGGFVVTTVGGGTVVFIETNLLIIGNVGSTGGTVISFDGGTHTNTTPMNVTGSRGGNAALASLLTALASVGLITDSTTP